MLVGLTLVSFAVFEGHFLESLAVLAIVCIAGFKARLRNTASAIQDKDLAEQYRRDLFDRTQGTRRLGVFRNGARVGHAPTLMRMIRICNHLHLARGPARALTIRPGAGGSRTGRWPPLRPR